MMPPAPAAARATVSPRVLRLVERRHAGRAARAHRGGARLDARRVRRDALRAAAHVDHRRPRHLDGRRPGAIGSATLLAAAAGGLLFGVVADRYGRTRALMASVVIYSVFTAACGLAHDRRPARGVPDPARHRHGRRVGERRGAGVRDVAGRASRQGARVDAERVGDRLRPGGCRDDGGAAAVGVARRVLRRRAAGVSHVLGAPLRAGARAVAAHARRGAGPRPARRRLPRRTRRRHGCRHRR